MAVNLQIQTALAEEEIAEALKGQPPIYLLDDKQCAAHTYEGDVVCAASWWEPAEEGGYNPAGLTAVLQIVERADTGVFIVGGLPLLLIILVIVKIRDARKILQAEESNTRVEGI